MELTVMTFNLHNSKDWQKRISSICKLIKDEYPDIIGTQECSEKMLIYMRENLKNYHIIRNSKKDYEDDNLILIKKGKIKIIKKDIFYLSKQPNISNSKNFLSIQPRKCSYVQVNFYNNIIDFYNIHLDFLLNYTKKKQLEVLKKIIIEYQQKNNTQIVVGDFNIIYNSIITKFEKETNLIDITTNLKTSYKPIKYKSPIDHILISPNITKLKVWKNEKIYNNTKASDHFAVLAKIKTKEERNI